MMLLVLLRLLELIARGAEALPMILALTLIIGRRGHADFCLQAGRQLLGVCRLLALTGFIWLPGAYVAELLPYGAGVARMAATLFSAPGLSWLAGFLIWLAGIAALYLISWPAREMSGSDRYGFSLIRYPFWTLLLASLLFMVSMAMPAWPSGGLPEGMDWTRAVSAIGRHSLHRLFSALCPAAAIALVLMQSPGISGKLRSFSEEKILGARWLAFWAAIGYLPSSLQDLGLLLGLLLRGSVVQAVHANLLGLLFLAAGMVFWFWQLLVQRIHPWLAVSGLVCLLLYVVVPIIFTQWAL